MAKDASGITARLTREAEMAGSGQLGPGTGRPTSAASSGSPTTESQPMAERAPARTVLLALVAGAAAGALFGVGTLATGGTVDWPVILALGAGLPTIVVIVAYALEPRPPLAWPLPASRRLGVPEDGAIRVLAKEVRGSAEGSEFAARDLGRRLSDLVWERLARRGTTPDDPAVPLSAGLRRYLAAADDPSRLVPGLTRRTLHAYLKEIDAL